MVQSFKKCIELIEHYNSIQFDFSVDSTFSYLCSFPDNIISFVERIKKIAENERSIDNEQINVILTKKDFSDLILEHQNIKNSLNNNDLNLENAEKILDLVEEFLLSDNYELRIKNHKKLKTNPFKKIDPNRKPSLDVITYFIILEDGIYSHRKNNFRQELYDLKKDTLLGFKHLLTDPAVKEKWKKARTIKFFYDYVHNVN